MCAYGVGLSEPRLGPGGRAVAYMAVVAGEPQLVVAPLDRGSARTVTTEPAPAAAPAYGGSAFDWTPDGDALVYAARGGDLWLASADGGPPRRLTAHGPVAHAAAPAVSPDGSRVAYVVDQCDVGVVALDGSWPVRLSAGADFCLDPAWTADSTRVVWHEWVVPNMPWDESRLVSRRADGRGDIDVLYAVADTSVQQPRPAPAGAAMAFVSDESGWANAMVLDAGTPAWRVLDDAHEHAGPTRGHGQRSLAWSPDGTRLAVARNEDGFGRLVVVDLATGIERALGRGVHGSLSWAGDRLAALRSGARTPTEIVVYDTVTGGRSRVAVGPVAGFDAADLPEPELVTVPASDGTTLHARWYPPLPDAAPMEGTAPMICWIHGGPTDQWTVTFRPRISYFQARGWSVLVPDHRGSTGHGRAYAQALRGAWGLVDHADCVDVVAAVVSSGRADPARVVAMGGSAGGFTVLNLLAHHGDRFAAGVALYPVTDLFHLDARTHRYEAHYCYSLVGPLPAAADCYRHRSPITVADQISTPLLLLHGTDDEVVPVGQTEALVERLRRAGRTVDYHRYEGEGHGWGRPETVVDELERVHDFCHRHVVKGHR